MPFPTSQFQVTQNIASHQSKEEKGKEEDSAADKDKPASEEKSKEEQLERLKRLVTWNKPLLMACT